MSKDLVPRWFCVDAPLKAAVMALTRSTRFTNSGPINKTRLPSEPPTFTCPQTTQTHTRASSQTRPESQQRGWLSWIAPTRPSVGHGQLVASFGAEAEASLAAKNPWGLHGGLRPARVPLQNQRNHGFSPSHTITKSTVLSCKAHIFGCIFGPFITFLYLRNVHSSFVYFTRFPSREG